MVAVAAGAEALPRGADGVAGEARAGVTLDGKRGAVTCRHTHTKKKTHTTHEQTRWSGSWLLELEAGNIPCFDDLTFFFARHIIHLTRLVCSGMVNTESSVVVEKVS